MVEEVACGKLLGKSAESSEDLKGEIRSFLGSQPDKLGIETDNTRSLAETSAHSEQLSYWKY